MSLKPLALLRAATKVAGMLAVTISHPVLAANINSQVPTDVLLEFCSTQPADSETRATFTGTDGTTITGTVECDSHDLQELAAGGAATGDDDGTADQGGANEDDANDDANDDNGGEDDSSDDGEDDSGDDSSDDGEDDSSDDSGDDSSDDSGDDGDD